MRQSRHVWPALSLGLALLGTFVFFETVVPPISEARSVDRQPPAGSEHLMQMNQAFRAVSERVQPSVVHVLVERRAPVIAGGRGMPDDEMLRRFRRFFGPDFDFGPGRHFERRTPPGSADPPRIGGHGSGWIYDTDGHIVTNHHVVKDAESVIVKLHDKSEVKAKVIGSDAKTDVAVLKIDRSTPHAAQLARQPVAQGEIVFAFGSPFQYEFSVSQGIVSGQGRQMGLLGPQGYESFIQTDAAINPGNSGGPLTNVRGEVVGMNSAIASTSGSFAGIGFAIPIDMVRPVVDQLIDGGKVTRGYLGAWISDDKKLLKSFGVEGSGVLIQDVIDGSPAADAGLKAGDVLLSMNGKKLPSVAQLRNTIASKAPGTEVKFTVRREGKELDVNVTLREQGGAVAAAPETQKRSELLGELGLEGAETFTGPMAEELDLKHVPGVLVTEVRPGSIVAQAGIRPRSIITHVMNEPVRSVDELVKQLEAKSLKDGVRLRVVTPEGPSIFALITKP